MRHHTKPVLTVPDARKYESHICRIVPTQFGENDFIDSKKSLQIRGTMDLWNGVLVVNADLGVVMEDGLQYAIEKFWRVYFEKSVRANLLRKWRCEPERLKKLMGIRGYSPHINSAERTLFK